MLLGTETVEIGTGESMRATEVKSRSITDLSPESALRAHCSDAGEKAMSGDH
jgi:hypothetical protein